MYGLHEDKSPFQFLIGILKTGDTGPLTTALKGFQFLIGILKTLLYDCFTHIVSVFQFLIGILKTNICIQFAMPDGSFNSL